MFYCFQLQIVMVWRSPNVWRTFRTSSSPASKTTCLSLAPSRCRPIICPDFLGSCLTSGLLARKAASGSSTWNCQISFPNLRLWKRSSWTHCCFKLVGEKVISSLLTHFRWNVKNWKDVTVRFYFLVSAYRRSVQHNIGIMFDVLESCSLKMESAQTKRWPFKSMNGVSS